MEFSLSQALDDSWQTFKARPPLFSSTTLATTLIPSRVNPTLFTWLVGLLLSLGATNIWLKASAQEPLAGSDLVSCWRLLLTYILCSLLKYLILLSILLISCIPIGFTFLLLHLLLPGQAPYSSPFALFTATALLILLPLFNLRFAFADYLILERAAKPSAALKQSWQMSRDSSRKILKLILLSLLLISSIALLLLALVWLSGSDGAAAMAAFCLTPFLLIGGVLFWPIASLTFAFIYRQLLPHSFKDRALTIHSRLASCHRFDSPEL